MPPARVGSARHRAPLHGEARLPAGAVARREGEAPPEDQLRRLPDQHGGGEPRGPSLLPDADPRPLGPRDRRGPRPRMRPGGGRLCLRVSRLPGARSLARPRGCRRAVHLPLPRRERLDRADARPRPHSGDRAGAYDGRHRSRSPRLPPSRRGRVARALASQQHGRSREASGRPRFGARGRGGLRPRRQARQRPGRRLRPRVLERDHPPHLPGASLGPEGGAGLRRQGPLPLHPRPRPQLDLVPAPGRSSGFGAGELPLVGGPRLPREPRVLPLPAGAPRSRWSCS